MGGGKWIILLNEPRFHREKKINKKNNTIYNIDSAECPVQGWLLLILPITKLVCSNFETLILQSFHFAYFSTQT